MKISALQSLTSLEQDDITIILRNTVLYKSKLSNIRILPLPKSWTYFHLNATKATILALDGGSSDPTLGGPFWVPADGFTYTGDIGSSTGGSWSFAAPDYRGRSPIGASTTSGFTLGQLIGSELVYLSSSSMNAPHTHTVSGGSEGSGTGYVEMRDDSPYGGWRNTSGYTLASGSGSGHTNMHPFLVTNIIIRTPRVA